MRHINFSSITKHKLLIFIFASVIFGGHLLGTVLYVNRKEQHINTLLNVANLAAASIDIDKLKTLDGTSNDINNVNFEKLHQQMVKMGDEADKFNIIWIYGMLIQGEKIIFSFDSLVPGEYGYGPPGQEDAEYLYPPKEIMQAVKEKKPKISGKYTDEYGTYISAFVPIIDPDNNEVLAVIGTDMDYQIYTRQLHISLFYPLSTVILALLFLTLIYFYIVKVVDSRQKIINNMDKIEHEKAKLETILATAGEPIIICDNKGVVTFVNQVATDVFECKFDDIIGKPIFSTFSLTGDETKSKELLQEILQTVFVKKERIVRSSLDNNMKVICLVNNKEIPVVFNLTPIINKNKIVGAVGVINDISHIVEIDNIKSEFISLASHQLRTPISKIKWITEMLVDDKTASFSDSQKSLLKNLSITTEQLISIVTSLLNVSRIESGRIAINSVNVPIEHVIDEVTKSMDVFIKQKKQKLFVEIEKDLPHIKIDTKLIGEVYKNLISNAIKYSPENGKISIEVYAQNNELISRIIDCGYGIPQNQQNKVFKRFFRADNIVKVDPNGSGLGLYLAKSIVEMSGGKIYFESQENKGTTFTFTLPLKGIKEKEGSVSIELEQSI